MQIIGLIFHLSGSRWRRNVPKGLREQGCHPEQGCCCLRCVVTISGAAQLLFSPKPLQLQRDPDTTFDCWSFSFISRV